MNVLDYVKSNILLLDGGTGTLLQKRGLKSGESPERWGVEHSSEMVEIHKEYFDAGSNVVNTNTFGANSLHYSDSELEEIIKQAIINVRTAAQQSSSDKPKFVSYDMGPTGKLLKPLGELDFEFTVELFAKQARLAEKYGADLISIETMSDCYETKAALLAVKENTSLPVFVTNAYNEDGSLLTGASPEAMVAMLEGLGADAVGLNCSYGPDKLMPTIKRIAAVSSVPVIFKPNAGLPEVKDGKTVYSIGAEEFAKEVAESFDFGVNIAGGCCGTTPEYIAEINKLISGREQKYPENKNISVVSCSTHAVSFGSKPVIVGERINPTGKKLIKQALKDNDIDYLVKEGIEQRKCGAHVLDVNCGLAEIDECAVLPEAVEKIQAVCALPLQIDTADTAAMEKALRIYNGKAMINSVNGKESSMQSVFPLAKKYGGFIVALTLDENGIPDTAEQRLAIAERIIKRAAEYGIKKKDLIFDPLCMTVSADDNAAKVTLDSVKLIRERTGCNVILGVSNVSFGLPARQIINSYFLSMAFQSGLTAAIINPLNAEMMNAYSSFLALSGLDKSCLGYIERMSSADFSSKPAENAQPDKESIKTAIVDGRADYACSLCEKYFDEIGAMPLVNEYIIPALDVIGQRFEQKTAYLPQLLMSADAAKSCFEIVKSKASAESAENKYTVILATVHGDIHDIGKNIVALLLDNYGYNVIDLGKNVSKEEVLKAAEENGAKLVGLSALMTTTVPAMEDTVKLIKEKRPDIKVIVGGAVLTDELASRMNADAYCPDAMASVRFAESIE